MVKTTETTYECRICKHKSSQISHHNLHLTRKTHKKEREILKLKLEKVKKEKLMEKFGKNDVEEILTELENHKIVVEKSFEKKKVSGLQLWSIKDNEEENKGNETVKKLLTSFVKKCHQLLYSTSSIVGTKAQNDIMKIFSVMILGKLKDLKENSENIKNEWRKLMSKELIKNYPNIFFEEDKVFNCKDDGTINRIIKEAKGFELNKETRDSFSTTYGDIYEYFMSSYGKKSSSGSKELGQFFTPRKLIHLIFHGFNLKDCIADKENFKIYDPCMGTGGFLTRLYRLGDLKPENIFGCETEIDTIKFGVLGTFLSTGEIPTGLIKCNSLSENPLISKEKFDGIVTNPPFGTSMNYQELEKTYNSNFPESEVKFQDVYPIKTNVGACLFVQHCIYVLKDKGFCAIVLPDGELFEGNSKWSKSFRKWFSETVNIKMILKVPSGTFDHAGVKTNVVFFTKDGSTKNIRFMETTKECDQIKEMFTISASELKIAGYSLDIGEYLVDETDNYDVPMVAFDSIVSIKKGSNIPKGNRNLWGTYPYYGSNGISGYVDRYNFDSKSILLGDQGSQWFNSVKKCDNKFYASNHTLVFNPGDKCIYDYIYLYLNFKTLKRFNKDSAMIPEINLDKFKKHKIPLPSLEVQQQIVDELSQIETSIETIESRISQMKREKDQYKKYGRKAEIRELLKDSEEKMLGEVCDNIQGGHAIKKENRTGGEIPYYGANGHIENSFMNKALFDGKYIICAQDGSIGSVHRVDGKFWPNNHTHILTINDDTKFEYVYYNLKYNVDYSKVTTGQIPKLNQQNLKEKIKISVPSQEVQRECIALFEEKEKFIQSIDEKIKTEQNYIEELKQLAKDVISSYC